MAALLCPVSAAAEDSTKTESIRCAAVGGNEFATFNGFEFHESASFTKISSKSPHSEGIKGGNLVDITGKTYYRAIFPYGSDSISLTYDLTEEVKKAEDEAEGDEKNEKNDGDTDKEDSVRGTEISGSFAIGVYLSSNDSSDEYKFRTQLTFTDTEGNKFICHTVVHINKPYVIYADADGFDGEIASFNLKLYGDESADKSLTFLTTLPYETKGVDLSVLEDSGLLSVVSHKGKLSFAKDAFILGTDTGDVLLEVFPEDEGNEGDVRTTFVTLDCSDGEGTVAAVRQDGASTESSHSVFPGNGEVPVRTVRYGNSPLALLFRSGSEKKLTIDRISFYSTDELPVTEGSFTTLTYAEGVISATGKLSSDMVNRFPKATVGLFTESVTISGEPILLDEIRMTSRFSFTVSLDKYPHAHTDNTFFVGIITDGETIPVTKSRFVSAKSVTAPSGSVLALHGANPISVFESGVTTILMDVDIARLITNASASSITVSRGGYIYGLDAEYLRKLDSDMSFYRSFGVSVYFRFICKSIMRSDVDGSWLTYQGASAEEYLLRADNQESLNIYPAVAAFLSQRYENIASFVVSSGVNSKKFTGMTSGRLWDNVSDTALICRLIYGAASEYIPSVTVSVPLVLSGNDILAPAEIFSALFAEKLGALGDVPWCLMYTAGGNSPSVLCENINSSIRLNEGISPLFFAVIYEASDSDKGSTADYESFCDASGTSSVKTVFLSVTKLSSELSRESYSTLKNYGKGEDAVVGTAVNAEALELFAPTGSASLFDFSNTYSPEGWSAGYGMASLQSSPVFDGNHLRALRCITDPTSPAGIFLCPLDEQLDLRDAPLAEFVFSLDAAETSQVIFLFGNDTSRAEFTLRDTDSYEKDGKLHALCDLSKFSAEVGKIGYVGVIIYSDERATFELSAVNVHSNTLADDGVAALILPQTEEEDKEIPMEFIVLGAVSAFVFIGISLRVFTVLSRRDIKAAELFKKEKEKKKRLYR